MITRTLCRFFLSFVAIAFLFAIPTAAMDSSDIGKIANICYSLNENGTYRLFDSRMNPIADGFTDISEKNGFLYGIRADGSKALFDRDGTLFCDVSAEYTILPPVDGVYGVCIESETFDGIYRLYDCNSNRLLFETNGFIRLSENQRCDKLFLQRGAKTAVVDRNGNFLTDFIYDGVVQTFNPEYDPFPHSYAIVIQNGITRYIDFDLNEINLSDYNGKPFITDTFPLIYRDYSGRYKDFYVVASGEKYGIYDMQEQKLCVPFLLENQHCMTNGKYITFQNKDRTQTGVMDFNGNIILPLSDKLYCLSEEKDLVSYAYTDEEGTDRERFLHLPDGEEVMTAKKLENSSSFAATAPFDTKAEISDITAVFSDGTCTALDTGDRKALIDLLWTLSFDRVVSYLPETEPVGGYYLLYNSDRTKCLTVFDTGDYLVGRYGEPFSDADGVKQNYVWYRPSTFTKDSEKVAKRSRELREKYKEKAREKEETDSVFLPTRDVLSLAESSEWAKPEIEKAAALNLLPYDYTRYYGAILSRAMFCKLAAQLLVSDINPKADSRQGYHIALSELPHDFSITDCNDSEVQALYALGIVNGVGEGLFAPDRPITREEAATVLYRLTQYRKCGISDTEERRTYSDDALISEWAKKPIAVMTKYNILKGVSDAAFDPKGYFTVEQMIAVTARLHDYPSGVDYRSDKSTSAK